MRIAVTGSKGQVARCLAAVGPSMGVDIVAIGRPELDLLHPETVLSALSAVRPDAIVSAAAYTAVDKAETERDLAFAINGAGAGAVAEAAARCGVATAPRHFRGATQKIMEPFGFSRKHMDARTKFRASRSNPSQWRSVGQSGLLKGKPCPYACPKSPRFLRFFSSFSSPGSSPCSMACPSGASWGSSRCRSRSSCRSGCSSSSWPKSAPNSLRWR
ncbi:MAG: sugar nucleotide-binding protein [Devosia sp.]|nr:sugar nucleotide-binding protein [Devosia sp.]